MITGGQEIARDSDLENKVKWKPCNNFWCAGNKEGALFIDFVSNIGNIIDEGNDSVERETQEGQREENCWKDVLK